MTVIVPWPAGGPSDLAARPLGRGLSDALGKPMVIDNRGGASGNIGTAMVAKSPPDGYTLLITSSAPIVINPNVFKSMPFDAQKDLVGITNVLRVPLVLAVHPSLGVKDLKGLMAWIDKNKDKAQYASAGNGTPQHMTGELFKTAANLKGLTHVPYKGSAPAITDAIGGHVPMVWDSTIAILSQLKEKKLIPIAVTSAKRHPQLPDVPTMAESGIADYVTTFWTGVVAPAGTPANIVALLNGAVANGLRTPAVQESFARTGAQPDPGTAQDFADFIAAETRKWAAIARTAGLSPE